MPGKPDKTYRIRVRAIDGKPRDTKDINKLKSNQLGMPHLDIHISSVSAELIICASKEAHIDQVRAKLGGVGLEEIQGDTAILVRSAPQSTNSRSARAGRGNSRGDRARYSPGHAGGQQRRDGRGGGSLTLEPDKADLKRKPYGFVSLPAHLTTAAPAWHDGTSSEGRLSGEVRLEIEALTPLLVGWERGLISEDEHGDWPIESRREEQGRSINFDGRWSHPVATNKSVLCPLRAPWGERPVIIPGDSLKGLLRHELGALLGAPKERVAERTYSYRPNIKYPDKTDDRRLEPRLARVRSQTTINSQARSWPVPQALDILSMATRDQQAYFPRREQGTRDLIQPTREAEPYKGGMGGGEALPEAVLSEDARRKLIHTHIDVQHLNVEHHSQRIGSVAIDQYIKTLDHLLDTNDGHFSARHPNVGTHQQRQREARAALEQAAARAFQPGDIIWVEWDTQNNCIVSLGWHYYYRWAYADSVRRKGGTLERHGLFPLDDERKPDEHGAPIGLSAVRRLLGYTGDNDGSTDIGQGDHKQLMGRLFPNAAVEVVESGDTDESRFLPPTFLKELGMPRPSAVEHYLKQPHHPRPRPTDQAKLVTYGDAADHDQGGELAGRKFYLDRKDAYTSEPWKNDSETNRLNDRSTLALEASQPGRRFRFTLRFRDLDPAELAAVLVVLCPDQFKATLGGTHADGYCSKLGYARPLGWGSVRIEAKALLLLADAGDAPTLTAEADLHGWVKNNHLKTEMQEQWLAIHRRNHPDAADYPRRKEEIFTFHTTLRAEHSRARRYSKDGQ